MDSAHERKSLEAARAYVAGDSSEPVLISAFRSVPPDDRAVLLSRHRPELEAIDGGRLLILESMLLPWEARSR